MKKEQITDTLRKIISDTIGDVAYKDDQDLTESGLMDSLDGVELVMALEDAFAIEIPDEEMERQKSFNDIVKYLEEHVK